MPNPQTICFYMSISACITFQCLYINISVICLQSYPLSMFHRLTDLCFQFPCFYGLHLLCVFVGLSLYSTLCLYINNMLAVYPLSMFCRQWYVLALYVIFDRLQNFSYFCCSPTWPAVLLATVFNFL